MNTPIPRTSAKDLLNYGLLGWALGAVAVPIYIQVPYLYSRIYEVPSAWVGIILLISRLLDAVLDPAIGLWVDRRSGRGNRYALPLLLAVPLLLLGMAGVFFPLGNTPTEYAASLMVSLIVVHLGYSFASIAYRLGGLNWVTPTRSVPPSWLFAKAWAFLAWFLRCRLRLKRMPD